MPYKSVSTVASAVIIVDGSKISLRTQSLTHLTGKNIPFEWTTACETSFQTLKTQLISAPLLANPMDDAPYVLDTDASLR
jgi:hypothetical protein